MSMGHFQFHGIIAASLTLVLLHTYHLGSEGVQQGVWMNYPVKVLWLTGYVFFGTSFLYCD